MKTDYLIVGSGLFGSVLAERIATQLDKKVLVLERRQHVGGNCFSEVDPATDIEFHTYGTHVFHTSNPEVHQYLSRFTTLNGYRHQVLARHGGRLHRFPFNLETINSFFGRDFSPSEAEAFISSEIAREGITEPRNLEEKAISMVGRGLYEAFVRDYTRKQWGRDPVELPPGIIARIPVKFNYSLDYFNHCRWQGIPDEGYAKLFDRLLSHPNIRVESGVDFFGSRSAVQVREKTIYTGPIDRFFDFAEGPLEWRSVRFEKQVMPVRDFQGIAVLNHVDRETPQTRTHEPRHLHPERKYSEHRTLILREFSEASSSPPSSSRAPGLGEPSYPIRSASNLAVLARYRKLAADEGDMVFGGRLGDYAYYDMDMTIAAALAQFARLARTLRGAPELSDAA